jgi:hypothetical protein
MIILNDRQMANVSGGVWLSGCTDPPDPPPSGAVWLPPNPDNPTANALTAISPD